MVEWLNTSHKAASSLPLSPTLRTHSCLQVLAVGATAFPGLGKGKALEKREVDGYTAPHHHRHHPAFPYIQGINATNPAPAVSRCLQPSKTGICRANMPRWFYDAAATACRRFTYGGCQGNDNNFPSEDHCRAVCPGEGEKHCLDQRDRMPHSPRQNMSCVGVSLRHLSLPAPPHCRLLCDALRVYRGLRGLEGKACDVR
ncbi:Amyloid-like protein 2 [Chionoecetes opilio]|uniref:Amyloid-like protein 2 n=1 Tax=Chionoecetes opilio TaxID=41210 RepID=A0A8J4Y4Z3_CHIOP|nr:Amyloid-like protein 2 [Chionoecetes opilio]